MFDPTSYDGDCPTKVEGFVDDVEMNAALGNYDLIVFLNYLESLLIFNM